MTNSVRAYYKGENHDWAVVVRAPKDMDQLIDALLAEPFDNSIAVMYSDQRPLTESGVPDHEFRVAVNAEDKVGALWYSGGAVEKTSFAKGARSRYNEVAYYFAGSDQEFPTDSDLPLETVRQAAREFLTSGGARPTCVQWHDDTSPDHGGI